MTYVFSNAHGRAGHLNVVTPDEADVVTGFGKHARVVAFHPDHDGLYIRVDLPKHIQTNDPTYPNLPEPTLRQILSVARKDKGLRGRWRLCSREVWDCGGRIDFRFARR